MVGVQIRSDNIGSECKNNFIADSATFPYNVRLEEYLTFDSIYSFLLIQMIRDVVIINVIVW